MRRERRKEDDGGRARRERGGGSRREAEKDDDDDGGGDDDDGGDDDGGGGAHLRIKIGRQRHATLAESVADERRQRRGRRHAPRALASALAPERAVHQLTIEARATRRGDGAEAGDKGGAAIAAVGTCGGRR